LSHAKSALQGRQTGDASSSASGASLAKYLDLPVNAPQWPSVKSNLKSYSLGVTQRIGRLSWGYQHDRSSPTSTLQLARGDTDYTASMDSASRKREAYLTLDTRHGTFFATRSSYVSDSAGTVLVGLVGRGDTQLHLDEQRGMIGWRQTSRTATNQVVLDYRRSAFSTYGQDYAGIFSGLFADVYALRGNGQVSTKSVWFGHRRDFGGHWQWVVGLSGHEAKVDGWARLRQSQGLGQDPLTLFEYNVKGGVLRMAALTLGLNHTTDTHRIGLTVTGACATANDAFRSGTATEPASGSPGRSLRVRPIWTVCLERFL
jgi:hypothetical protein